MSGQKTKVIKGAFYDEQIVGGDTLSKEIVNPYLDYEKIKKLYGYNVYHQRAIKLKASLLSQIEESNLSDFLPSSITPKRFLNKLILNLEVYGSAFIEKVGEQNPLLYIIQTPQARIDIDSNIYFSKSFGSNKKFVRTEGYHLLYDGLSSDFYGEPDYLTAIPQILTTKKADSYNDTFFQNGAKPAMAIVFENADPSDEQITAITDFFKTNYRGYQNAHKNLVLSTGVDAQNSPKIRFEKLGEVEDISFEKLKSVNRDEIIASHAVPPRLVGVMHEGSLGGNNELMAQLQMFAQITIEPKRELIESYFKSFGINLKIKPFDVTTFKDDTDMVTGLVNAGILTQNEAKELLGWSNG